MWDLKESEKRFQDKALKEIRMVLPKKKFFTISFSKAI